MENSKMTDDLLYKILPKLSDELIEEWEKKVDENHKFSLRFKYKMRKLIQKEKSTKLSRELRVIGKIAAAVLIIIGGTFMFSSLQAQADPQLLFQKIEIELDGATMYIYDEELDNYNFTPYEPTYVPEGYTEISRDIYGETMHIRYLDEENNIITWNQKFVKNGAVIALDTEYSRQVILEYAGDNIYIAVYEDGYKSLYYETGNSVFIMNAENIDIEDMYKMIKNMKRIEK